MYINRRRELKSYIDDMLPSTEREGLTRVVSALNMILQNIKSYRKLCDIIDEMPGTVKEFDFNIAVSEISNNTAISEEYIREAIEYIIVSSGGRADIKIAPKSAPYTPLPPNPKIGEQYDTPFGKITYSPLPASPPKPKIEEHFDTPSARVTYTPTPEPRLELPKPQPKPTSPPEPESRPIPLSPNMGRTNTKYEILKKIDSILYTFFWVIAILGTILLGIANNSGNTIAGFFAAAVPFWTIHLFIGFFENPNSRTNVIVVLEIVCDIIFLIAMPITIMYFTYI
jgi:hypothetical protein